MPLCASPISQVNSCWDLDQGTCCKHNKCQMKRPGIPRSAWLDFTSQVWPMQFLSVIGLKVITLTRSLASRAFNFDNWRRENILLHFDSIFFSSSSRSWKNFQHSEGTGFGTWDLESCKWIVGRGGRRGNCPLVNYHPNWKTVCQPFATSDLQLNK